MKIWGDKKEEAELTYLYFGTSVVWLGVLGYVLSLWARHNQLSRKLELLEQRVHR